MEWILWIATPAARNDDELIATTYGLAKMVLVKIIFYVKKKLMGLLFCLGVNFLIFGETIVLPDITFTIENLKSSKQIILSQETLENFSCVEQALESVGFSFKSSNQELTFHGYWNSSIKVYVNSILMNDPNTGKFDFSTIDFKSIKSIKVDCSSCDGAVSIYIVTFDFDYTKKKFSFGVQSKSYFSANDFDFNDNFSSQIGFSIPCMLDSGSAIFLQEDFTFLKNDNHYGYVSDEATYKPSFSDSYCKWQNKYSGYEKKLFNNSLCLNYSFSDFPGANAGFINFISYSDNNCGRKGGFYFVEENECDLNISTAFSVFLPFKNHVVKLFPSYKFSNIEYNKNARYSTVFNSCLINNFSFRMESTHFDFLSFSANCSYDYSIEENKSSSEHETFNHDLFTAFAEFKTSFAIGEWNFLLAAPINYFSKGKEISFLYNFNVQRRLGEFELFFNAAKNITNPVFQQLYYSFASGQGNPFLKSENAYAFHIGAVYDGVINCSLKPFLIFYNDKIQWREDKNGVWKANNVSSSINYGFDFGLDSKEFFDRFKMGINYTFCKAILTGEKATKGNQIMYTPVHSASIFADAKVLDNLFWKMNAQYTSKKYLDNFNNDSVSDYYNLSTKILLKFEQSEFYLLWDNVFDFKYTFVSGYPLQGTSLTVGVKWCDALQASN